MARTVNQIASEIKAAFVANETLRSAYNLNQSLTFDEQFSTVSIEGLIIYTIALTNHIVERMMDAFRDEVEQRIQNSYLCSIPWYYNQVLNYQHGYILEFDPLTYTFKYPSIDEEAKIIKHAAVRQVTDTITVLKLYALKSGKVPLTSAEAQAFQAYINQIGAAGTHYQFVSQEPDLLRLTFQVIFNPLVIDDDGKRLGTENYPVREALEQYVSNITFGGTLNRTKLIDAIQAVEGVEDVILTEIKHAEFDEEGPTFETVTGQNIEAASGAFTIDLITDTYTPNV